MDNHFLLTDDHLWDFADGLLSAEENLRVEAYLRQHPEWQAKLDALLAEKRAWTTLPLESPNAGFADRVMAAWTTEQLQTRTKTSPGKSDWIVFAVAGAFGLLILLPVIALVVTAAGSPGLPTNDIQLPDTDLIGQTLSQPGLQLAAFLGLAFGLLMLVDKYLHQRRMLHQLAA